jgi:hypothetical protein
MDNCMADPIVVASSVPPSSLTPITAHVLCVVSLPVPFVVSMNSSTCAIVVLGVCVTECPYTYWGCTIVTGWIQGNQLQQLIPQKWRCSRGLPNSPVALLLYSAKTRNILLR